MWNTAEDGKDFRRLKIACELAKRLWENEYNTNVDDHYLKWGEPEFYFSYHEKTHRDRNEERYTKKELKKLNKEFSLALHLDYEQQKAEKKYLFTLLERYMEDWWD